MNSRYKLYVTISPADADSPVENKKIELERTDEAIYYLDPNVDGCYSTSQTLKLLSGELVEIQCHVTTYKNGVSGEDLSLKVLSQGELVLGGIGEKFLLLTWRSPGNTDAQFIVTTPGVIQSNAFGEGQL